MNKPLYELAAAYRQFLEIAFDSADEGGVIPDEAVIVLKGAEGELKDKLAGCCQARAELTILRDGYAAEEKRIAGRRKALERQVDWLENYMREAMQTVGETTDSDPIEAGTFKLKLVRNPPKLEIFDPNLIPEDYDALPERKINNESVKKALKEGVQVPGAQIVQGIRLKIS